MESNAQKLDQLKNLMLVEDRDTITQFKNKLENNLLDFAEVNFKNSKSKPSKMVMDLEKIINNE
jgi:hypothetical protein